MEKLEKYLDQVCRSIGGPVEMRQHVRQELRGHLLDAVAQHKAAGLTEQDALKKAIEEFGKPEEVRSELEATHGQRTMWLIDKAMQWKERTMRATWLWVSWAYLGLGLVIAIQILFITFNVVFIIPKFKQLLRVGVIDPAILDEQGPRYMVNYLDNLSDIAGDYTLLWIVVPLAAWLLFEWRVKSENKSFMRLSALGTAAIVLTVVVALMAGSMVIAFCLGVPALGRMTRPWADEQVRQVETSFKTWDASMKTGKFKNELANKGFREETRAEMLLASTALTRLSEGPALWSLIRRSDSAALEELRAHLKATQESLREMRDAVEAQDLQRVESALKSARKSFAPIQAAAEKRPEQ